MNTIDLIKTKASFEEVSHSGYYDVAMLRLCMDLTINIQGTRSENEKGIRYFYERALELAGEEFNFHIIDLNGKVRKINKRTYTILPSWFEPDAEIKPTYGIYLKGGKSPADSSEYVLDIGSVFSMTPHLRLQVPIEYFINQGVQKWIEFVVDMTDKLHILTGYSGFGSAASPGLNNTSLTDSPVYKLSRRYPAIDYGRPSAFEGWMEPDPAGWKEGYIKRINWLTFLDTEKINRLGGIKDLKKMLAEGDIGKGIIIHQLQYGIMIQAGPEPDIGDVNKPDTVQYYYHVGKILKSLRIPEKWLGVYDGIGGTENTKEWLGYFDESK